MTTFAPKSCQQQVLDSVEACFKTGQPALLRMWDKRQRGYRAMGYRIEAETSAHESLL